MTYTAKQLPTDQIYASTFQPILYIQNIDSTKMRMLTLKNAWFSASSSLPKEKKSFGQPIFYRTRISAEVQVMTEPPS